MSLFGSIQLAGNTLRAADIALQVVGNNIANANTPGFTRQEVVLEPAPTQRLGNLLLGLGVRIVGIVQKFDENLGERLRNASSDAASSETQKNTYEQLEGLLGELGENDLSTSLNNFFASVNDVLNQPESVSVRNLAVLKGKTLAGDINRLAARVQQIRRDTNDRVNDAAIDINRLLNSVRDLNIKIAESEGGLAKSDAAGLRDQRNNDLADLAKLIDITVREQTSGGVAVFTADGDYLVYEGNLREVRTVNLSDRGQTITEIRIADIDAPVAVTSGEVGGLVEARDAVLGGFLDKLDTFAQSLTFEFNKLHASGQGLNGYQTLTSEFPTSDTDQPLDDVGLPFTPVNGSFEVLVYNKRTKLTETTRITVDLNGLDNDTSLEDLQAQLDAVDGISASISADGKLTLTSDSADQSIAFANDTSGVLAALGLNTFFSGSTALDMGVNAAVVADPSLFAASKGGVGADTENAIDLAGFLDRGLESHSGATLTDLYSQLTGDVTQASAVARSVFEGFKVFEDSLSSQSQAASGVNLDEEAIKMMSFQRMYQASAKYIATLNGLLDVLVNL
jgi:flagellar hook-associated protein 1 FlgK